MKRHAEIHVQAVVRERQINLPSKQALKNLLMGQTVRLHDPWSDLPADRLEVTASDLRWTEIGTVANGFQATQRSPKHFAEALAEAGEVLLVGPDPYNVRRWYGTAFLNSKGELKVK